MNLYRTTEGLVVRDENAQSWRLAQTSWDAHMRQDDLRGVLERALEHAERVASPPEGALRAPIGTQEVWAAGVTYYRSRTARMEEARAGGGSDFYDRVYHAQRPELFFKASSRRVVGPGGTLRLRRDSRWIVPEPELTLVISPSGTITAYTIGNDLSCRDIEGENPLYLPQAKTFDACAALGPALWISDAPLPAETEIRLEILRNSAPVFSAATDLRQMKRRPDELVAYLCAETTFPDGCLLMTGTGIVPPDDFTLVSGDEVRITIEPIGTLANVVRSP